MALRKPVKKTYPAKKKQGNRQRKLPAGIHVKVHAEHGSFHVTARGKTCVGHSEAWVVRKLAEKLGYSAAAFVSYVSTDADGVQTFLIMELQS